MMKVEKENVEGTTRTIAVRKMTSERPSMRLTTEAVDLLSLE
jgi:hypothetical protein